MADLTDIYESRLKIGLSRQPRHSHILKSLDAILRVSKVGQPYKFKGATTQRQVIGKFKAVGAYTEGSEGYVTQIVGSDSIYRLSSLAKVAKSPGVTWHAHLKPTAPDSELYRLIENDYKRAGDWINLSRYCTGHICNDRNLSWWTTFAIPSKPVNESAHLLGITNNWLNPYSVVLKLPIPSLTDSPNLRVPTVIDAYPSPVFHTTRDAETPTSGITVALSKSGPLSEGVDEYVLKIAEVKNIQLMPVFISDTVNPYFDCDSDVTLWDLLFQYYDGF